MKVALTLIAGVSFLECAAGPAPEREGSNPRGGKLASVLYELAMASDRAGFAEPRGISLSEGRVRVIIFMPASTATRDRERLVQKYDLLVEKTADRLMRARVPVDVLIGLSRDPAVLFVDLPDRPGI